MRVQLAKACAGIQDVRLYHDPCPSLIPHSDKKYEVKDICWPQGSKLHITAICKYSKVRYRGKMFGNLQESGEALAIATSRRLRIKLEYLVKWKGYGHDTEPATLCAILGASWQTETRAQGVEVVEEQEQVQAEAVS